MIPDETSLEFLLEHLKFMIQEQPDKKIEKISDLTEILSDFMSTFLVVVDALLSTSQRRFKAVDEKMKEFEDLLLSASIKGLSELSELSHAVEKQPIKSKKPLSKILISKEGQLTPVAPKDFSSTPPSPPPPSTEQISAEIHSIEPNVEVTEDLEVEDLVALAFQKRKTSLPEKSRITPQPLGSMSLKMELMTELKKKFGTQIKGSKQLILF